MPGKRFIKAVIQYDGTSYCGFQYQPELPTIQGVVEDALTKMLGHKVRIKGAGRTDAGVHAKGQVISFSTCIPIPTHKIPIAAASFLPEDIFMVEALDVDRGFDPVRDTVSKTYCYRILRTPHPMIMCSRFSLWYPGNLDFCAMVSESECIKGRHDFKNYMASGSGVTSTVREVLEVNWTKKDVDGIKDAMWEFRITADGFLYKMVRLLVGSILDVGRGHLPRGWLKNALNSPARLQKRTCVPGKGLCLEEVNFS